MKIFRDKTALDRGLDFGIDPLFKTILTNAKNFVNEWEGKLYFVYLPDKERYLNANINEDKYLKRSQIIELLDSLNIPIIDLHKDFFIKQTDPLRFFAHRIYGHYSPEGYQEVSSIIYNKINKN